MEKQRIVVDDYNESSASLPGPKDKNDNNVLWAIALRYR